MIALTEAGLPAYVGESSPGASPASIALWFCRRRSRSQAIAGARSLRPPPGAQVGSRHSDERSTSTRRRGTCFRRPRFSWRPRTPHKPKSCDGLIDRVYWVNIEPNIRSYLKQDDISASEFIAGFLTFGLSAFQGPENPHWTIFSAKTDGRYVTFLIGQPRGYWDDDKVGPQTRLTYYKLDVPGKRLALVETAPIDAPPFVRPQKGTPRYETVQLRCVYRSSGGNAPIAFTSW